MSAESPLGQRVSLCRNLEPTGPAINKWELFDLVKFCREELGVKEREIAVLGAHLSVMPTDLLIPGALNTSYMQVSRILMRANCMDERSFRRGEATLEDRGCIWRNLSPNKRRFPLRKNGKIVDAYGIDLNPLLQRVDELRRLRDARIAREEECNFLRTKVSSRLHALRESFADAAEELVERIGSFASDLRKITRRKSTGPEVLHQLIDRLAAFEQSLCAAPCPIAQSDQTREDSAESEDKNPAEVGQSVRHNESLPKESKKDLGHGAMDTDVRLAHSRTDPLAFQPHRIRVIWSDAAHIRALYPEVPGTAHCLYNTLHDLTGQLMIKRETLAAALVKLGWERLVIVLDYLAEKVQSISKPSAYFKAMLSSFEGGQRIAGGRVSPDRLSSAYTAV
ncbi:helix-turn-helix domain-containing protein [Sulfitobacter sp. 1A13353]|uniref:helix-turn-helix domain-containing protein n=1 Tax=Sulfitobacter sp. 1A13353 TaxID=3368568 RepID=UPI0037458A7E